MTAAEKIAASWEECLEGDARTLARLAADLGGGNVNPICGDIDWLIALAARLAVYSEAARNPICGDIDWLVALAARLAVYPEAARMVRERGPEELEKWASEEVARIVRWVDRVSATDRLYRQHMAATWQGVIDDLRARPEENSNE